MVIIFRTVVIVSKTQLYLLFWTYFGQPIVETTEFLFALLLPKILFFFGLNVENTSHILPYLPLFSGQLVTSGTSKLPIIARRWNDCLCGPIYDLKSLLIDWLLILNINTLNQLYHFRHFFLNFHRIRYSAQLHTLNKATEPNQATCWDYQVSTLWEYPLVSLFFLVFHSHFYICTSFLRIF